ncbi:hypothetical protein F8M41_014427 [Gigaspora margarita]|uniref:Uncharacterized protein n=1 Tax=Gigaspora margarita TaxID=4874 RepID=A0A8H4ENU1_GIGMA|nr:hypothetical protein F8M41_014427 [Gigaspora margarita]
MSRGQNSEDLSFSVILEHEKGQEFGRIIFLKREAIAGEDEPIVSKPEPEMNSPETKLNSSDSSDSNGGLRPSYYLLKSSQIMVETSTEDIAEYFTNQIGNKTEEVFKNEVVDWAKTNGYNDQDANNLGENAKKLVDCKKNSTLSSEKWKFNTTTNNSCISCEQINGLSSIYTHSNLINGTETLATLKLLYSLYITIKNTSKCEFNLIPLQPQQ